MILQSIGIIVIKVRKQGSVSLRFISFPATPNTLEALWVTVQAKNHLRSTPASTALTLVSHRSHNVCTTNCHLHGKGARNGVQKKTNVSFGRTMMQTLELLRLAKRQVSG